MARFAADREVPLLYKLVCLVVDIASLVCNDRMIVGGLENHQNVIGDE